MSADYTKLKAVLDAAYEQSATGKGSARHQRGEVAFDRQPILEIGRMVGPGFALGQVMKKAQEADGMVRREEYDKAMAELLGAIVYCAAAVVLISETQKIEQKLAQTEPVSSYAPRKPALKPFQDVATVPTPRASLSDALRAVDRETPDGAA